MPQRNGAAPVARADSEELDARALLQRAAFLLKRAERTMAEMGEILGEILVVNEKRKLAAKLVDENGEPTWRYKVRRTIPDDIRMTSHMRQYAIKELEAHAIDIDDLFVAFVNWYRKSGKKWQDWSRVWFDWCREERKRHAANRGVPTEARTSRTLPEMR